MHAELVYVRNFKRRATTRKNGSGSGKFSH